MSQYHHLSVKEVIRETADAVTIVFAQPEPKISYKPGQFLTLIIPLQGEKHRRSYSLCSSPFTDDFLAVTVKRVVNGKISNLLVDTVKAGDKIEVMQPMGTFTIDLNYHFKRNIVLIGGGSGITPLMSIAKSVLSQEPLSKVYLLFGNRNEQSIIFRSLLDEMQNTHEGRFRVIHKLSQPGAGWSQPAGRMNQSEVIKLLESFPDIKFDQTEYFICGPEGLMEEVIHALKILKVPQEKIHRESFVVFNGKPASAGEVVSEDPRKEQEVTILYQGSEYKLKVPPTKTILEAALDEKIDLPYSCQSGMCTACMGKCISGKVHLNDPDGLSDKEIEQGFVLTCVGRPVTGDVVIEIE